MLRQVINLLNPIMPYVTEELSKTFFGSDDLLLSSEWPEYGKLSYDKAIEEEISWLFSLITSVRSVRSDMNVPAGAKIPLMVKDASEQTKTNIERYREIILQMARLSSIEYVESASKGAIQTIMGEATLILPVAEFIDLERERARLEKEIEKLSGEAEKIDRQLANENFVANAPADIVEEHRQKKQEVLTTQEKLVQALKQLEAA